MHGMENYCNDKIKSQQSEENNFCMLTWEYQHSPRKVKPK